MLAAKEVLEVVAQLPPLWLSRHHRAKHRVPPRVHAQHNPRRRASQVAAANRQAIRTIHRHQTLQVPALMMKMTMMTVRIHQAPLHQGLLRHQLAGAVGVVHYHQLLQKASGTTEAIVEVQKSVAPLHTVLLTARAVVSHLVLDHLHMDMTRTLGAMVVTVIGVSRGSRLKQAGCHQVVEVGDHGMVSTMTGTRAGLVAPAHPALGHPPTLSAKLPAAAPSLAKGHSHHTRLENHERKRSLAKGAGTERSS